MNYKGGTNTKIGGNPRSFLLEVTPSWESKYFYAI
jgi:hypothetical protein